MKSPLQRNPFAVEAWFDFSITLTFAVPKEELAARLPACLEAETFADRWAFIAVALVQTRNLRPRGLPGFLGQDFLLAGYRHFVAYRSMDGRRLRGLQIIRSETDRRRMVFLGNMLTPYRYIYQPLKMEMHDGIHHVTDTTSGLHIATSPADEQSPLPAGTPFSTWKDARRFCGPMPFTFSYDAPKHSMLIIEGVREQWKPAPVCVHDFRIPHLARLGFSETRLACAFMVRDIPYHWKKGRYERLTSA
jgi:Uncharacterized conserved protein (COG2071)